MTWISVGVGKRFADATFENYISMGDEQDEVFKYLKDEYAYPASLLLLGGVGTGKTHLACSLLKRIYFELGGVVRYITAYDMLLCVKETWGGDEDRDETERDVINYFGREVDFLVIDEIGKTFGSDTEKILFFEILDRRYRACKPTVLCSNCGYGDLKDVLGVSVLDRLREDGGKVLLLNWESHRK